MNKVVKQLDTVIYEKEGKIARIILNRPEKLNAMNANVRAEIIKCIDMIEIDDDVLVGILKGNGRAFSAGADLEAVYSRYGGGKTPEGKERRPSQRARLHVDRDLWEFCHRAKYCWKPLICQVHGYCIGLGLMLSHSCDITIAAEDARLGHPEQRLVFGGMMSQDEVLLIGPKKARELLLLGTLIDGKEAERIGWVNHAVPIERLEAEVEKMANAIALLPRDAIALGKMRSLMVLENLGYSNNHLQEVVMHTLATNARFEADEYNFIRQRGKKGARTAFHERDARFEQALKKT